MEITKKKKKKRKKKKQEKKVCYTKIKPMLNPHCSKCPHRPPQSLTPQNPSKYQKKKNYDKLYKMT